MPALFAHIGIIISRITLPTSENEPNYLHIVTVFVLFFFSLFSTTLLFWSRVPTHCNNISGIRATVQSCEVFFCGNFAHDYNSDVHPSKRLPRFPISRFLDIETVVRHLCVREIEHFPVNNRNRNNMKFIDRRCRRVKMCSPKIQSISYC